MSRFLGVFAIFLLSHLIAATPAIRRRLVDLLGEVLFTICYSAMSLTLFTWLIKSAQAGALHRAVAAAGLDLCGHRRTDAGCGAAVRRGASAAESVFHRLRGHAL
jgi:hypothetical protein